MFDDSVRSVEWLLQGLMYCVLLYKDVGAMREITAHKRALSRVMTGWSSLQLRHHFCQFSYVSNLIYGVAAPAVEEFSRKVQGSVIYQFCCTAMKIILKCHAYA